MNINNNAVLIAPMFNDNAGSLLHPCAGDVRLACGHSNRHTGRFGQGHGLVVTVRIVAGPQRVCRQWRGPAIRSWRAGRLRRRGCAEATGDPRIRR